uniref:Tail protein n=1 Tax=Siphoviridae sp. ctCeQ13 TaxID=2825380 RepID=A0A8S5PCN5_9CAUD|nr:MAG TPA: tail protein [Siphoviridae sp. ctCeQ13]
MTTIYDSTGKKRATVVVGSGSVRRFALMGDDYVTLKFVVAEPLYIAIGDYIDTDFGRFVIVSDQKPNISKTTGGYEYELKFEAPHCAWKNKISMLVYKQNVGNVEKRYRKESSWNHTADIITQAEAAIIDNLDCLGMDYRVQLHGVDEDTASKSVLVTYDNTSIYDALTLIADAFDVEWWIVGNIIYFGKCQFGEETESVDLTLGDNVSDMGNAKSSADFATRFYVYGSDRNLRNYRKNDRGESVALGVVTDRLMLPKGTDYIDLYKYDTEGNRVYITDSAYTADTKEMPSEEVVENTIVFDDVYPKQDATITDVFLYRTAPIKDSEGNVVKKIPIYWCKVDGFIFDRKYLLEGKTIQMMFQSGLLSGMTFDVTFNPANDAVKHPDGSVNKDAQRWELVYNTDYGRELPDETLKPSVGDKIVFINFDAKLVTEGDMVADAEKKLYTTAVDYIKKQATDNQTYDCTIMCDVARDGFTLDVGQRVRLVNAAFFRTPRKSRVIGWEIPLDIPYDNPVYTIGEAVSYSTIGTLSKSVEALTAQGQRRESGSGGVYLIRSYDNVTPATDLNAYSALRALRQFVNAVDDDDVAGLLKFAKGLQSAGFMEGSFGRGFELMKDRNGRSYLEIDEIFVRMRAVFESLEIKHVSHVGGEDILSPAGIECYRVETVPAQIGLRSSDGADLLDKDGEQLTAKATDTNVYRCYFKTTDGERTIYNQFAVGDLALCREFNTKKNADGTTLGRYYWRAVVGVGTDYIDLSITDCLEGSDEPMKGDTIVCLGNKSDKARQNAVVVSSYGVGSPSIKMYQGIKTFALSDDNAPVIISPDGNKFTGDFVSRSGDNIVDIINGKAKVYTEKPSFQPYKVGDLWVNATDGTYKNELLRCVSNAKTFTYQGKLNYLYNINDWKPSNGYTSEIKQTSDAIKMSVYALGQPKRNYATLPQTYKTTLIKSSVQSAAKVVGSVITDGLYAGQKLYLSFDAKSVVNALLTAKPVTIQLRCGSLVVWAKTIQTGKGSAVATSVADEVLTVQDSWLLVSTLDIVLTVESIATVTLTDFRVCLVPNTSYSEAQELKLKRTGIDIENERILLQADTTEFVGNDGTTRVRIFGSDGKINAEMIDADSIVAKSLQAKTSLGTVDIDNGAILLTDANEKPRMRISGGNLSASASSVDVAMKPYTGQIDVDESRDYYHAEVALPEASGYVFKTANGAVAKLPTIGLGVSELVSDALAYPGGRIRVRLELLLDGKVIGALDKETAATDLSVSGTLTLDSLSVSLSEGIHSITANVWFWGNGNAITSTSFRIEPNGNILVTYPTDMVEIAADGFRAATAGGTYIQQTAEACVMVYQQYRLEVSGKGIRVTADGNNWINLI